MNNLGDCFKIKKFCEKLSCIKDGNKIEPPYAERHVRLSNNYNII